MVTHWRARGEHGISNWWDGYVVGVQVPTGAGNFWSVWAAWGLAEEVTWCVFIWATDNCVYSEWGLVEEGSVDAGTGKRFPECSGALVSMSTEMCLPV